jgi:hypothetical protein
VLDLGDRVGADGQVRVGQRVRLAQMVVAPPVALRRAPPARPGDRPGGEPGLEQFPPARAAWARGGATGGRDRSAVIWSDLVVAHGALPARDNAIAGQRARPRGAGKGRPDEPPQNAAPTWQAGCRKSQAAGKSPRPGNAVRRRCVFGNARGHRARGRLEAICGSRDGIDSAVPWRWRVSPLPHSPCPACPPPGPQGHPRRHPRPPHREGTALARHQPGALTGCRRRSASHPATPLR